ncbi:hypothetical protein LUZ63_019963 [Rhynchospora breviuscula]|uniref:DNA replication complex GINS protein SLD5 n=1 Tax=Rhynchospora breviuscula TaxID=2022672 RepID=A0A9Q0HK07_9POAL|nr:hypothetical protein LUZ63_019963 [Rhynchospora breviuscula]
MESWEEEGLGLGLKKTDVEAMREAWRREKAAPEMLEFEEELVRRLREQMQLQEETGEDEDEDEDELMLQIQHMDLDRALFLLKAYLRIRLTKLQKHIFFYASQSQSQSHSSNLLSPQELLFCQRCLHATSRHLHHSLLSHLPPHYQSLSRQSTSSDHDDMLHLHAPHLDTFVFCKTTTHVGAFQLDDTGDDILDLVVDDLYVLRYNSIRALVQSRQIHLI